MRLSALPKQRRPLVQRVFQQAVVRSWWVILFTLVCYMGYERAAGRRYKEQQELKERLAEIEAQKADCRMRKEELLLQINSQSDPEWIELTLMKGLGLVPEGQVKVLFSKESEQ